jgi:CRISPR-associated protein Cmr6
MPTYKSSPRSITDLPLLTDLPLPAGVRAALSQVPVHQRHPGLQLDRFAIPGDQERQREALISVTKVAGDRTLFAEVSARRKTCLEMTGATCWTQATSAPLTLHLARANALENAGICLHPIYGFPYLPGSGLKGMARAYATEILKVSKEKLVAVFGNEPGASAEEGQSAGSAVFHDSWPVEWPQLIVDIVNNHHPNYYQGEDAPGDWDSPRPVYFLAIPSGAQFTFAIGKRRQDTDAVLLQSARTWLEGALVVSGAGAKTAAGYGSFTSIAQPSLPPTRRQVKIRLELTTPAFLAGALQEQDDCQLRSATLRGLLRWWWRTMHAGFLTVPELRCLEAAVWGDSETGSPLRLQLLEVQRSQTTQYTHKGRGYGMRYAAYGMDEKNSQGEQRQRYVMHPGAIWELRVTTRKSYFFLPSDLPKNRRPSIELSSQMILNQALAAIWLFTKYGGLGSKARKGFGSMAGIAGELPKALEECELWASEIRLVVGLEREFDAALAESPSIFDPDKQPIKQPIDFRVDGLDGFDVMDQIGQAYQAVASRFKHDPGKAAWGLPRKIHGPLAKKLPRQTTHTPPIDLISSKRPPNANPKDARYASPIHFHVASISATQYLVSLIAVPAKYLLDRAFSIRMLKEFVTAFQEEFAALQLQASERARLRNATPSAPVGGAPSITSVTVKVLERRKDMQNGNPSFMVQEEGKAMAGMLQSGTPPKELPELNTLIQVYLNSANANPPQYRWDPPVQPGQGGQRGQNRRRGAGGRGGPGRR